MNGNEYTTNGVEVIVTAVPVKNQNFTWNLSANASRSVRKLTEIYGGAAKFGDFKLNDRADAMYTTVWSKSGDGQVILSKNTGMPTRSAYKENIGHQDPDLRFGFQNTFKVKGFTVQIDMDGAIGGTLISTTTQKMWWGGKHLKSVMYREEEYANGGKPVFVPQGVNVTGG